MFLRLLFGPVVDFHSAVIGIDGIGAVAGTVIPVAGLFGGLRQHVRAVSVGSAGIKSLWRFRNRHIVGGLNQHHRHAHTHKQQPGKGRYAASRRPAAVVMMVMMMLGHVIITNVIWSSLL